jgi:hypothetical protein
VGEVGAALVRTREGVSASRIPEPREREGDPPSAGRISTISNHGGGYSLPACRFRPRSTFRHDRRLCRTHRSQKCRESGAERGSPSTGRLVLEVSNVREVDSSVRPVAFEACLRLRDCTSFRARPFVAIPATRTPVPVTAMPTCASTRRDPTTSLRDVSTYRLLGQKPCRERDADLATSLSAAATG